LSSLVPPLESPLDGFKMWKATPSVSTVQHLHIREVGNHKEHIRKQIHPWHLSFNPQNTYIYIAFCQTPPSICWHPEPTITGNPQSSLVPVGTGCIGRANDSSLRGRMAFSNPKKKKKKK
jgi:hypothetical protein